MNFWGAKAERTDDGAFGWEYASLRGFRLGQARH